MVDWRPIEEAPRFLGKRLLLAGIYEGHKWIEICQLDESGAWVMSHGGGVLGARYFRPLPYMPEM